MLPAPSRSQLLNANVGHENVSPPLLPLPPLQQELLHRRQSLPEDQHGHVSDYEDSELNDTFEVQVQ